MKSVLRQEYKMELGTVIAITVVMFIVNAVALTLQSTGNIDLLGNMRTPDDWGTKILTAGVTVVALGINFIFGLLYVICHCRWSLRKQFTENTRCLLLTIPRTGAEIFGGKFIFAFGEFVFLFAQGVFYSVLHLVNLISVNSQKPPLEVFMFIIEKIFIRNLPALTAAAVYGMAVFTFVYTAVLGSVMLRMFCRRKMWRLVVGGLLLAYCVLMNGWGLTPYAVLAVPALFLLLLNMVTREATLFLATEIIAALIMMLDLPGRAVMKLSSMADWDSVISYTLPLMEIKEQFCPASVKFLLGTMKTLGGIVEHGEFTVSWISAGVLLILSAGYFILSAWYFTKRMEE